MKIEEPTNRHEWQTEEGKQHDYQYQMSTGMIKIIATDLYGRRMVGEITIVNEAGLPIVIKCGEKKYVRCPITDSFYEVRIV